MSTGGPAAPRAGRLRQVQALLTNAGLLADPVLRVLGPNDLPKAVLVVRASRAPR